MEIGLFAQAAHPPERTPYQVQEWNLEILRRIDAETDEQAHKLATEGGLGRFVREYTLQVAKNYGLLPGYSHDQSIPDSDVTVDYMAEHVGITGSPSTVVEKLEAYHDQTGGFGTLLVFSADYLDDPTPWHESLEAIAQEVQPKVAHL